MGQVTFTTTASTWVNSSSPNTNYSSATQLQSPAIFRTTNALNLKYKKITKATLTVVVYEPISGGSTENMGTISNSFTIRPYSTSSNYNQLTYNNYQTLGVVGEAQTHSGYWSRWMYSDRLELTSDPTDITDVFVNGIHDNLFEFILTWGKAPYISKQISITVDYEDSVQPAPTPTYPVATYLRENEAITFSWSWNSSTGATQKSVELAYKLKTASSWTTVALTQTGYSYKLANGLPQGEYVWKIKGTNEVDEVSAYSGEVAFNVIGKPSVPVIQTPANKTLTQITWNATNQAAYEIKLTDSNGTELIHETIASAETVYLPNLFLKGNYTVGIAYCNTSGYWSEMAYKTFAINPSVSSKPTASAELMGNNVRICFSNSTGINQAIMRSDNDGPYNVIAVIRDDSTEYIDKTVIPGVRYTYVVRNFVSGYRDSEIMPVVVNWAGAIINGSEEIHLKFSVDRYAAYTKRAQRDVSLTNYSGRAYALAEFGEYKNDIVTRKFYVTEEQAIALESVIDKVCYYRDDHGNAYRCCITELQYSTYMDNGYEISLQISRVSESEVELNV